MGVWHRQTDHLSRRPQRPDQGSQGGQQRVQGQSAGLGGAMERGREAFGKFVQDTEVVVGLGRGETSGKEKDFEF